MRGLIQKRIVSFVDEFQKRDNIKTKFGEPIVGVADAWCSEIQNLRNVIGPSHVLPQDVLSDAKAVIAYYVPFTKELALTNREDTSPQWARAYEELNLLFAELNVELVKFIEGVGTECGVGQNGAHHEITAAIPVAAGEFDQQELISNWSQRHMAFAAGLGTFGINNMLITRKGCCGRFSSIVTNLGPDLLPPDKPMTEEQCLYKAKGSCKVCKDNCPVGAINLEKTDKYGAGFSRAKCYEICLINAARYPIPEDLDSSYGAPGSEVCGKCITSSPCAFR